MIYKCKCGRKYEITEEQSKWTYFIKCDCGGQAKSPETPTRTGPLTRV